MCIVCYINYVIILHQLADLFQLCAQVEVELGHLFPRSWPIQRGDFPFCGILYEKESVITRH